VWDPNVLSPSSLTSALYMQVPLAVVLTWDMATKQRLFFEHFLLQKQADGSCCVMCAVWSKIKILNVLLAQV